MMYSKLLPFSGQFVVLARDQQVVPQLWEPLLSNWHLTEHGAILVHVSITHVVCVASLSLFLCSLKLMCKVAPPFSLSSLLYRVVIIFIIIKIFFYVCWYRSRQRQLAAYLSNPRNAQIVIVGGRACLHQMCERQSVSADPSIQTQTCPTFETLNLAVDHWSGFAPPGYVSVMAEDEYASALGFW